MTSIIIPLWAGTPPHARGDQAADRPFLEVFRPADADATGSAMLIFPGGAYSFLSAKSGQEYAQWLAAAGIHGAVVHFRLGSDGYRYPALLADARQAFVLLAAQAAELNIDPERIGVIGTSAGGHLAALLLTGAAGESASDTSDPQARPRLGVLCYPVISLCDPLAHEETRRNFLGDDWQRAELRRQFSAELHVSGATGATFIWHTNTDDEVTPDNTWVFASQLRAHQVPHELHLYGCGGHALGLARQEGLGWPADCIRWLRGQGF